MTAPLARLTAALADRYRVERELGQGGMATVYLAADLRHDRQVALKVLRPDLAAVIGASRFLHEIKTTANLQHPHILALHDSGEVDGTVYYVMPFIEGESLRDRLLREKQLPVDEAVRIAVEVAGALEYAHQHKVIHRDIKPENILLQGGHALVADFGIALAAARSDSGTRMTETGMSLGTPHYMSPEQAMGEREITAKSDVYALGCVLYEMLTGEPPFTGPTAQAIVARVMTEEPRSLTLQRRTVPRHVEAAVHRALSKLPADRFASAAQFAEALLNPGAMTRSEPLPATAGMRVRSRWALPAAGGLALLAAGGVFLAGRVSVPSPPSPVVRFTMELPDSVQGIGRCCGAGLALSPDGNTLVFVGNKGGAGVGGPFYRRSLGRLDAEPIPGTDGGSVPFISPDGRWVGFFLDGRLRKVALAGGPPIPIAAATSVAEASWGAGNRIVFSDRGQLWTVAASGGEPRPLTKSDSTASHYAPSLLPDGKAVLLTIRPRGAGASEARIGVADLESGRVDTIGLGTRATYANGYLVFAAADNTLLAQPFDPKHRKTTGEAVAFLDRITLHGGTTHEFTVSPAGGLAYLPAGALSGASAFRLVNPTGTVTLTLPGRSFDFLDDPAVSPDGHKIALVGVSASSTPDLWLLDRRQGGTLERFTVGGGSAPSWSRDGRRIAFSKGDGLYVKNSDGSGDAQLMLKGAGLLAGSWLPDNKSLTISGSSGRATRADIGILTLGDSTPRWLLTSEFRERHPQVSHDGRWLAYASDRTGRFEVYVQPLTGGPAVQVSTEGGVAPRWSPDDRVLFYPDGKAIIAATRAPGAGFVVAGRKAFVEGVPLSVAAGFVNWDLTPDGKQVLVIDQSGGGEERLAWILNWPELVRTMATAK